MELLHHSNFERSELTCEIIQEKIPKLELLPASFNGGISPRDFSRH
jgi:hypothetical protein